MPTQNSDFSAHWRVTKDSNKDSTDAGPNSSIVLSQTYEYLGASYVSRGDEILIFFASNIPSGGHELNENDGVSSHGVAFINPNSQKGISSDNTDLIAVRFSDHHDEVETQYQKPTGAFRNFELASVTDENGRRSDLKLGDYEKTIMALHAAQGHDPIDKISYGESIRVNESYLGDVSESIKNEIIRGDEIANSGYRKITVQEKNEAISKFIESGITSPDMEVTGFAISKTLLPLGESTISLWAECGNDAIAVDLVNIGNPEIEVIKRVNGLDAKTPATAAVIEEGQKVVYTIDVANTGDVELIGNSINVVDPGTPLFLLPFTDVGNDNVLSPGEIWSYAAAPTEPDPTTRVVLDFDYAADGTALKAGDSIATQYASLGVKRISGEYTYNPTLHSQINDHCKTQVSQETLDKIAQDPFGTMIFDTGNPTGNDDDLRTSDQSMALIISEDGDTTNPDDNCFGGTFIFEFETPVFAERLGFVDLDAILKVKGFLNNTLVGESNLDIRKPKEQSSADITDLLSTPIDRLELSTRDSFALTELSFTKLIQNKVDVTVTDLNGRFSIEQSDSAFYLNLGAEALLPAPRESHLQPDLNGDGIPDLLWRNVNNGMNVVWSIDNFAPINDTIHSTIADTNWKIATYDDFDGDGNTDLLLRNTISGTNLIRRLGTDGTTTLGDIQLPEIPDTSWDFIDTADFDQDGNVDILMRHQTAGVNLIWNLDGAGGVQSSMALDPIEDTNWKISASADFNQDGKPDLLLRHQVAGINLIRQLDGIEILGDIRLPDAAGNNLHIEGSRDFNNDGSADIVWRDRSTGENYFWELNGTQFVREVQMTVVDSSWQLVV